MSHPEKTTMITEQQHSQDRREALPDPDVVPKAQRRKYSAAYKLRILQDVEACTEPGQVGALLRQEGLYSSHLTRWRQRAHIKLGGQSHSHHIWVIVSHWFTRKCIAAQSLAGGTATFQGLFPIFFGLD